MIKAEHLSDRKGAGRFGTCSGCGKTSGEDPAMIRIVFACDSLHTQSLVLCSECRKELCRMLSKDGPAPA